MNVIICQRCSIEAPRTGYVQRYCAACSVICDLERKKLWARANYTDEVRKYQVKHSKDRRLKSIALGKISSAEVRSGMNYTIDNPVFARTVRISIPFTSALLKNHSFALARQGHIFLRAETRKAQDDLILLIKQNPIAWTHNKVWIDILVQKPNNKAGDAINMLDRIADAVKKAIDIDDRWFSVRRIDWEVIKDNPLIYIGISQEDCGNAMICSFCGRLKEFSEFYPSKKSKTGIGRECRPCVALGRASRKIQ